MDYNKTIHLPKTDFPMRAGLPRREPDMLKAMEKEGLISVELDDQKNMLIKVS